MPLSEQWLTTCKSSRNNTESVLSFTVRKLFYTKRIQMKISDNADIEHSCSLTCNLKNKLWSLTSKMKQTPLTFSPQLVVQPASSGCRNNRSLKWSMQRQPEQKKSCSQAHYRWLGYTSLGTTDKPVLSMYSNYLTFDISCYRYQWMVNSSAKCKNVFEKTLNISLM